MFMQSRFQSRFEICGRRKVDSATAKPWVPSGTKSLQMRIIGTHLGIRWAFETTAVDENLFLEREPPVCLQMHLLAWALWTVM